ncbi:MAG: AsmA family protein [Desulfobacteraceae bacterium]|jgi:AsmA protein
MKKTIKWIAIVGGALVALVIIALLIVPSFVDLQSYKPRIEKMVSEATGRPFSIGGDIDLSLFPWVGFSSSDIHLGNPPGFEEKDFASLKTIEVRVKLIPLISKDIQVKRFIIEEPRIALEKSKSGRTNWEGIGKKPAEAAPKPEKEKAPEGGAGEGLPIAGLAVGEFAITKGSIIWIDHSKGERKEISEVTLRLQDVSLDRPIRLALSAILDGQPIDLKGNVGPVGKEPGKGKMPVDLSIKALKELEVNLKGKLIDPATTQQFDLALQVSPFSPRKLMSALGQDFPVKTADPNALNKVGLTAQLKGNPKNVSISDGTLKLDESNLAFSMKAKDFARPDLAFDLNLDKIDLDRYLPPASEKKTGEKKEEKKPSTAERKKADYTPLRKLLLDGKIRVGTLKAHGAKVQDIYLKVSAKNGLINLDPLTLKLYQGNVSSKGAFDVRRDVPKSNMALQAKGIQVNPLLKDVLKKDFLEGTVKADMNIAMAGDDPEKIKNTLNGKGDLLFNDGAVVGIDLAGMVRNAKAAFGLGERGGERPRTDFSELHSPFTITKGVVDTRQTKLTSPLLRILAAGKANLVRESLDFRVEPKFVGTIKGQGDTQQRGGVTVPVLVTGTFSSPKFRPDLEGMLKGTLEKGISDPSELKKMLPGQTTEGAGQKPTEDKAKDLLKGLPFGR